MITNAGTQTPPEISVCLCTYKRPGQVGQLLQCLDQQATKGLFRFSIVVVDNDSLESARPIVDSWAERSSVPITYSVEPRQNIALARNASVARASGELVAFIDDDEEPSSDWLCLLYDALVRYSADGVVGPVVPTFKANAPTWAVRGGVFQRQSFETGEVIHWSAAGMGNALIRREVLKDLDGPFRPEFGAGGEDRDLFRRAMAQGRVFVWSAKAVCHEPVTPERTRVSFQLRRALLRGKMSLRGPENRCREILKSVIAVPLYAISLPLCLMMGSHVFVTYLVKTFDHLGRLLAICGIDFVGDKYIS